MSRHNPIISFQHMLNHAQEAVDIAQGYARSDLDTNRMLNLSLVRLMEIIGEAASRIPEELRSKYSEVPWPEISGLRNRLIHGYDAVNFDILWTIIQSDLPTLLEQIRSIIDRESE